LNYTRLANQLQNTKDKEYTEMKKFKTELWSRETQDHQRAFREQAFKLNEMSRATKAPS
jgi:hypothetical protein